MGPLVQLGLLCGPLVSVPLGRMVLQLLARFQPRVPSSEPLHPQSWPVIPPHVDPRPQGFFCKRVCQTSTAKLGVRCVSCLSP